MPCLKIFTNLPKSRIPVDFTDRIIPVLAKAVKKDEEKFYVVISSDNQVAIQGDSKTPAAIGTLESIGFLGPKENLHIIGQISAFVEKELGIVPRRFFLTFYDLKAYNVGLSSSTAEVLGA